MQTIHPSLARYRSLRATVDRLPPDRDGLRLTLQHMDVPDLNGTIPPGARTDADLETHDIINLSSEGSKQGFLSESFVELPPTRTFWGRSRDDARLVHLTRRVEHREQGQRLSGLSLKTVDLNSGEEVSAVSGGQALEDARKLEDDIPFRLNLDSVDSPREEENWLLGR